MKWATLLKDIKEKVGFTNSPTSTASSSSLPYSAALDDHSLSPTLHDYAPSLSRDKYELELDFKRFWEEFRSSNSEKEKEAALNFTVDAFCRLAKQQSNVAQIVTMLVETHIFSFVVGRAFVTDIEKLKISSKARSLGVAQVLKFFSEVTQNGLSPGSNLLTAVEILVSGPVDKQSLLDSGILSCLIHIFNALMSPYEIMELQKVKGDVEPIPGKDYDKDSTIVRRLEVEGSVVHIMKALASYPSAALGLTEDDSLQLLFQMVAKGCNAFYSKDGVIPLHRLQLNRHAIQILGLLLVNDNGSTAKYISKHHLIKVLLGGVKDFNPDSGDSTYTMGIVDLLLECVELSYRPDSDGVRLRDDIHNTHGYHFLVQFALTLSSMQRSLAITTNIRSSSDQDNSVIGSHTLDDKEPDIIRSENPIIHHLSPLLSRLLDVLINLAQTGPSELAAMSGGKGSKSSHSKATRHTKGRLSFDRIVYNVREYGDNKIKDLEAIQVMLEVFLKADNKELQAEVLNRMFKLISSHIENYELCQQLRAVPLFIQNMAGFPSAFQEIILKILEYAVTVVNCVPEQELLSLSCLLQQSTNSQLKQTILSFFLKLLSFDQQYKKVLREVGLLAVLLDELKQHNFLLHTDEQEASIDQQKIKSSSSSFKKHLDSKDIIISSPRLSDLGLGRSPIFEVETTIDLAWDCLCSLLKKAEGNQAAFRSANGVLMILPFLASNAHRSGALRVLSCLMIEDVAQAHSDELSAIVEVLKSGMVTSVFGGQYKLGSDAKCDTMAMLWRILGVNNSSRRIFGEATGFSLLLTTLHDFQSGGNKDHSSVGTSIKVFTYLFRLVTAGVCDNALNRVKLDAVISCQTFLDLLYESGLRSVNFEKEVIQLLLELALEVVLPPHFTAENVGTSDVSQSGEISFLLVMPSGSCNLEKKRVYNAGAIRVLIRLLLLFTPKVQIEVLNLIDKLARAGSFNLENLTCVGCLELMLETIHPLILGSSPLLSYALKIVEALGAYRISASELRVLIRYIFQMKQSNSGHMLIDMMTRLISIEDMASENAPAPFVEMDMGNVGHASIQVSLGERSWPPAAGYSFVCWFQFHNFIKSPLKEAEPSKYDARKGQSSADLQIFRIFSVGEANSEGTFYAELYLQEDGILTLSTSNSCSFSFSGLGLEDGKWHHLAVVHSKPNALAGLFQSSFAYVYLNGKLRHTGKLGYAPSPAGRPLQVTIGTPATYSKVCHLNWKLRSCYLFEEGLTPGCVCFMYILGRGYRGLFQDADILRFVPKQACGGGNMAILDSLDSELPLVSAPQRLDSVGKHGESKADCSGIVWDLDILGNLSIQLSGKKLIFAFDGTCTEAILTSGSFSMLNLVDPMSAAASPIGGIPRFGRLHGDTYICRKCVIGDTIRPVGGIIVILGLIEAAETRDMLHMAVRFLASALHQNPQNLNDMEACRGYHLLALFLRRRMLLFEMPSLEIFFQIAACEASFFEPRILQQAQTSSSPEAITGGAHLEDIPLPKFRDEISSFETHGDMDDFSAQKDTLIHLSKLENADTPTESSNCIVLSNADMVEHVLLDWTLWVMAPISLQISLLVFLEHLVSMHYYRNHNLTILRRMNLVQHLFVTLQRGDVEVPVLEKLVVLLGVILEDGFLSSELEHVVTFVIMTFDPPELTSKRQIVRESMGKHVIVRNMLLEMLIDLQVTIESEELLEQWHKIVSSKLITYFLEESIHPTSMRWIMTLLGVCLASSQTFALKFRTSGGYQGLALVLRSFYDSPEIYYILFCLMFGKPVYPRLPEVRILDFHALIPSDGSHIELKFVELLESAIAMTKAAYDRLTLQSMLAHETGNLSQIGGILSELFEGSTDMAGDLQGEALMHRTYAARLMGGDASAPVAATSILRFMVDLVKMCPPFSAVCCRPEFVESCVDLYFSCVRAACAVKMARELSFETEEKNFSNNDTNSLHDAFSSLPQEQEQSVQISAGFEDFPHGQVSYSSEDLMPADLLNEDTNETKLSKEQLDANRSRDKDNSAVQGNDGEIAEHLSRTSISRGSNLYNVNSSIVHTQSPDNQISASQTVHSSPSSSKKSNLKIQLTPPPVIAVTSWLGSSNHNDSKGSRRLNATPSSGPASPALEHDPSVDKITSQDSVIANTLFPVSPELLLEVDDCGYGGGPCSAGATAVLDFMSEVFADILTEQVKSAQIVESILENCPLFVHSESVLVFQGLCFSRLMIFLERRLLRDDEEDGKKLDKSRWSSNLDALCWIIVDHMYMGAFPQPATVLKTLEFLLSMLQLANKDGRIEAAAPPGKGLLSIGRGNKQLEAYIHSILKNTNRMIMYCFLPPFLMTLGEEDLLSQLGFLTEPKTRLSPSLSEEDSGMNISTILQLLVAHRQIIFCPCNVDMDLNCCLCVNIISLLHDQRRNVQNMAVDIIKYMLVHRSAAFEFMLVSKQNQAQHLDAVHGGFDRLVKENSSAFFDWLQDSQQLVSKVLEQCAVIMWGQYITGSTKFPGVRIKVMEGRRRKEIVRRNREISLLDLRHFEQINERRYALEFVRDSMSTNLRVVRQDKYGWILHAESEWPTHLQQLVHERGILPIRNSSEAEDPEWQLCPIEGPYRMRKKLERCKLKIDSILDVLDGLVDPGEADLSKSIGDDGPNPDPDYEASFHQLVEAGKEDHLRGKFCSESSSSAKEVDEVAFVSNEWNDDQGSSLSEGSLHSALEFGIRSGSGSSPKTESLQGTSDVGSPIQSSLKVDELNVNEEEPEKELHDNGEYLIRPYLEPLENIRSRYNCERVVGLDKHDGMFLVGELYLYVIENFYIDESGCICEKKNEDELSVIDQALGVKKDVMGSADFLNKSTSSWGTAVKSLAGGRAWAYNGGAWGKEKTCSNGNLPHPWRMWKLNSVHEILKRDYQLRPVAVEIFSMDGCNDLLVFHKKEREEVFKNLVAMNLPRNSMLDTTISGSTKQESNEGGRLFKLMAKSFSKRWQNGEISNFQYLMHLNTLAGRGYSDLTQYPVFPWVLSDYASEQLDLLDPETFRKLDKPMGCQTPEGEDEFKKRYESWDDPEVPKFHYGSHYSSAGIVLFYLLRLPPFSAENQKLQGGQFDHADRLFNSIRETWVSAAGRGNTSDVKELIPEFFYMPEFLENWFNLDLGVKQSGEKVTDVVLPPWAKGSAREFIKKHREALESDYVSENLHHWIDLIFGYKQRGKAAEAATNVFYHYTYEGSVEIDAVTDPAMKASILAQINHFGQTPKQLFQKPHVKRKIDRKFPPHPLKNSSLLTPREVRKNSSSISQIITLNDKVLLAGPNTLLKPQTFTKYVAWGFQDCSLRFMSYDQDRLLSTHENLHGGNQIRCTSVSHDGQILATGADDGVLCVWRITSDGPRLHLQLEKALCAHTNTITCVRISQPYMLIVSGSHDCTVILWDLSTLAFVRQLPEFPSAVTAVYVNDLTGEIVTAAGTLLAVWSINGDCLAVTNTSPMLSDSILSITCSTFSDWHETNWVVSGHHSGAIKVWQMVHNSDTEIEQGKYSSSRTTLGFSPSDKIPEYRLFLRGILKFHNNPVTSLHLPTDRKQLLSGDSAGSLVSWTVSDESSKGSFNWG